MMGDCNKDIIMVFIFFFFFLNKVLMKTLKILRLEVYFTCLQ